jgi:3-deoxy-manno-octulosonate cytidylyltransferase (CMP-KDO synthetase)
VLHVCDNARASGASFVVVATDDQRIAQVVQNAGFDAVMTSCEHRSGTDRLAEVARGRGLLPSSVVVNVQGDEPLLPPAFIRAVAEGLIGEPEAGMSTLAAPLRTQQELLDPNRVKVVLNQRGFAKYFSRAPIPFPRDHQLAGAEDLIPAGVQVLGHIGVYGYRVRTLLRIADHPPVPNEMIEALEQLRALWLGIPIHVSVVDAGPGHGVDTGADLDRVRGILTGGA